MVNETIKVLVITNLFPNSLEPTRGPYNRQQCLELSKTCELKVVAPLPWSPLRDLPARISFGARVPERETMYGLDIFHPRYFMTPKIGRSFYGYFFFLSLLNKIREISRTFPFDVIYAPWAYPDGVGSQLIARAMNKPVIIGALGSDINIYMNYFMRRNIITRALACSEGVVAVSKALKDKMIECGVPENKICVITNGVDDELFRPLDKVKCRSELGIDLKGKIILFVGNLVPVKGISDLLEAFKILSGRIKALRLAIVGDGPLKPALKQRLSGHLSGKVLFAGKQPHRSIPQWMNACDVFCLPSHSEGCPNVVLEAMACGVQIVATRVGGIPELVVDGVDGELVSSHNPQALSAAIENGLKRSNGMKNHKDLHPYVQNWSENAKKVYSMLKSASFR